MKMKKLRELKKNPPYKHTCACLGEGKVEYLMELPEATTCVLPRYFKRDGDKWIEVAVTKTPCF